MLSICIPIYNFDVTSLVNNLAEQIPLCSSSVEIVLIDDCSNSNFKDLNKVVCNRYKYIELEKNIGRSKIRNLFLEYISYDCILFLDCDSLITSNQFIQNYITAYIDTKSNVICGGRVYEVKPPNNNQKLSWKFGVKRESKVIEERLKNPSKSFMTNNFFVKREVLRTIPFDERLSKYGHEDTLFGYYLKQENIAIFHIDNPVLNGDIEENAVYLKKTELAIENLILILSRIEDKKEFMNEVTLLSFYRKLKGRRLLGLVLFLSPIITTTFFLVLKIGLVNLPLFNYYKLSYLAKVLDEKKS